MVSAYSFMDYKVKVVITCKALLNAVFTSVIFTVSRYFLFSHFLRKYGMSTRLHHPHTNVLVVGTIRNGSNKAIQDLQRIMQALETLAEFKVFVVESDSEDDTVDKLDALSKSDSRFRFQSLGKVSQIFPDRIERLRYCRNHYVRELRSFSDYLDCDVIIVADLDGVNRKLSTRGLDLALKSLNQWDAISANQSGPYYDILALRHPIWSPNNWMTEFRYFEPYIGKVKAKRHSLSDRQLRIPASKPIIPVDSAFGGICVYQRWVFEKCDYTADDFAYLDVEIDHVTLHRKMRSFGGTIAILPAFLNSGWNEHSFRGNSFIIRISEFRVMKGLFFFVKLLSKLLVRK
jgi:hypothetical protein